jgi:hypothetical protein
MPTNPRQGSTTSAVVDYLQSKPNGATMKEIADTIGARRDVQRHSIRSAVLSHVEGKGMGIFRQERPAGGGRAIYRLVR